MKQNITLCLDQDLIRKAKVIAAKHSSSVSQMLREQLACMVAQEDQYAHARNHALADLSGCYHLGGKPAGRNELHER